MVTLYFPDLVQMKMIILYYFYREDYRNVALYWTGSIGHSMLVFIPGNLTGDYLAGLEIYFLEHQLTSSP